MKSMHKKPYAKSSMEEVQVKAPELHCIWPEPNDMKLMG